MNRKPSTKLRHARRVGYRMIAAQFKAGTSIAQLSRLYPPAFIHTAIRRFLP